MKKCVITNGRFSFTLAVDGHSIIFYGHDASVYFKEHYKDLGYEVIMVDNHEGGTE